MKKILRWQVCKPKNNVFKNKFNKTHAFYTGIFNGMVKKTYSLCQQAHSKIRNSRKNRKLCPKFEAI